MLLRWNKVFFTNSSFAMSEIVLVHTWHGIGEKKNKKKKLNVKMKCSVFLESPGICCFAS